MTQTVNSKYILKIKSRGQRDSLENKALALHVADVSGIMYGALSTTKSDA